MMTSNPLYARVGAAAIAASVAFSPTLAAGPKPVVDLSQSPALSGKADAAAPAAEPAKPKANPFNGPFDERTLEFGGGALAVIALGGAAIAMNRRKRRREDEEAWQYEPTADEATSESIASPETAALEVSAFSWSNEQASSSGKPSETWVERAMRGPTPDNPSLSLRKRLKRAAFFDKRDREVAAGDAYAVDADAGLPENMDEPERQREAA